MRRTHALLGVVLVVSACAEGQSTITARCAAGERGCDDDAVRAPIALGGRQAIVVRPELAGALAVPLRLVPLDESVVTLAADRVLVGAGEGLSAVMVMTDGDIMLDVVHVTVMKPTRLEVGLTGDAVDVFEAHLDGAPGAAVRSGDGTEDVVVTQPPARAALAIAARAAGASELTLSSNGPPASLSIVVVDPEKPRDPETRRQRDVLAPP